MAINQAVLFSKPLWHTNLSLMDDELDAFVRSFFKEKGFYFRTTKKVHGSYLKNNNIIDQHYIIYSNAAKSISVEDISITKEGKNLFQRIYKKSWSDEIKEKRILTVQDLVLLKNISFNDISVLWNKNIKDHPVYKIDSGLLMKFSDEIDAYLINGFYCDMAQNFYNPIYNMNYYIIEFESNDISWFDFRKKILGSTNCSKADQNSFRGMMFKNFPVLNPGGDNFVHGSAGPFEGMIERLKHENEFCFSTNPLGVYLQMRNVDSDLFERWLNRQSIQNLSKIFDQTEEKNSDVVIKFLDSIKFH